MSHLDRRDFVQGSTALAAVLATVAAATATEAAPGLFYVIAELVAKPGKEADLRAVFTTLADKSRANEPGCKTYILLEVASEPGHFYSFEAWVDRAALDGHMNSPHVKEALPKLGELVAKPPVQIFLNPVSV
jgi:quinol monooxygenase YgiN